MDIRPTLHDAADDSAAWAVAKEFAAGLRKSVVTGDADDYDADFAADIVWGSPYGMTVAGYPTLNAIHRQLTAQKAAPPSRFEVVTARMPAPGVVVGQIRRQAEEAGGFSEMALYVLVERDGRWWLAAAQNTPIRS
ncbi:DUF4440 domain-containing protein [Nocardia crassostreae]|uniref:DUF4440 domain-containing protein n=1 Tax=Nocardia crassostreae TaxID=53428 RepID=UPI000ACED627|nr:DUF4440 domain-containing protein [Nocardia crassostreae]